MTRQWGPQFRPDEWWPDGGWGDGRGTTWRELGQWEWGKMGGLGPSLWHPILYLVPHPLSGTPSHMGVTPWSGLDDMKQHYESPKWNSSVLDIWILLSLVPISVSLSASFWIRQFNASSIGCTVIAARDDVIIPVGFIRLQLWASQIVFLETKRLIRIVNVSIHRCTDHSLLIEWLI